MSTGDSFTSVFLLAVSKILLSSGIFVSDDYLNVYSKITFFELLGDDLIVLR